ncbi:Hsp20/alpha crystallin family protein [Natronococcus sp. JC468]|uniref:Hsp20/alpha crystallin family protein n=1 Tax=Natronococcus sp. JC468 TaxID=1961921 RepID=UPI001439F80C|nr:Hsp20/alpha crystallin family protein [Natronococcus sp. JC468]NKE35990.1 Hsp20/alpha crystallin family protein [Natronococcus sp. JC468]
MSNHANDPTEPNDDRSDSDHWLTSLLSALERGDASVTGRRRRSSTRLNYDVSIGSGLDRALDKVRTPIDDDRLRRRPRRRPSSPDGHMTSRHHEEELLVTADVGGADSDDVTVGFDGDELVVAVSRSELDRVEVPWAERTATASFKNGVLTVVVEPTEERR